MNKLKKIIPILEKEYEHDWGPLDTFQVLVSCIMSQRTKDEITYPTAHKLFNKYPGPKEIAALPLPELEKIIKPVNYYKTKAGRIKEVSRQILNKYNGKIPNSRNELKKLPGVGDKTADIVLCYGFDKERLPIDVHVNKIGIRLGIIKENMSYEEKHNNLIAGLSKEEIIKVNHLLVEHGRNTCLTRNPKCFKCKIEIFCEYEDKNLK